MQATERYNSFDNERKHRFQLRLIETFSDNRISQALRNTWVTHWRSVHEDLGQVVFTLKPTSKAPEGEPTVPAVQAPVENKPEKNDVAVAVLTIFLVLVSLALVVSVAMNVMHRNIIAKSQNANRERLLYDTTKNEL